MPRPKKTDTTVIRKSAKSGQIVSEEFAKANPDTTIEQVIEKPIKAKKRWTPLVGQPFTVPDSNQVWELTEDGIVEHFVVDGVHATAEVSMEMPKDAIPLTRAQEILRLY